ncbi:YcjX family protein [Polycladidibacter stylochi]|uniref:YcjX family protein n=1 Tax=Polycladidibacter stylochi TaxID=1807766 RepID=UPI000AA40BEF|nr:YcjX family protein [Pseudovibrio stylochi]
MSIIDHLYEETRGTLQSLSQTATDLTTPSLRIGVTGLARAGKTVFISSLVHNLLHGGRLPLFSAGASGRISSVQLQPQPDDNVPRFEYEQHLNTLLEERLWPNSTRQISQLRLTIAFESASYFNRKFKSGQLHLDIIDYPGEWLLDLPLLQQDFKQFSTKAFDRLKARPDLAEDFLSALQTHQKALLQPANETIAKELAAKFTKYLANCRAEENALSMLPPGRFLMPGDLEGSPALTFCPLDVATIPETYPKNSLAAMMAHRYEAYKRHVIKPFFKNHFAKLDRQIVLVDTLQALNAGPAALHDLGDALLEILQAFRPGSSSWLTSFMSRRIDRILFAATKADHVQREDHDKLQAILAHLLQAAINRAETAGAQIDVLALASVKATRQAIMQRDGESFPALIGIPLPGQIIDGSHCDGASQAAVFPGDLPKDIAQFMENTNQHYDFGVRYARFRPPELQRTAEGITMSLPHIRLDRVIEFLLGDKLA